MSGGELASGGNGAATIVSVASAGEAVLKPGNAEHPVDISAFVSLGGISISQGGLLGSNAPSGLGSIPSGAVVIAAGNVTASGTSPDGSVPSELASQASTTSTAGPFNLDANGAVTVEQGAVHRFSGKRQHPDEQRPDIDHGRLRLCRRRRFVSWQLFRANLRGRFIAGDRRSVRHGWRGYRDQQ